MGKKSARRQTKISSPPPTTLLTPDSTASKENSNGSLTMQASGLLASGFSVIKTIAGYDDTIIHESKVPDENIPPSSVELTAVSLAELSSLRCQLAATRAELSSTKKSNESKIKALRNQLNVAKDDAKVHKSMHDMMEIQNRNFERMSDETMKLLLDSEAKRKALDCNVAELENKLARNDVERQKRVQLLEIQLQLVDNEKSVLSKKLEENGRIMSESRLKIDSMTVEISDFHEKIDAQKMKSEVVIQKLHGKGDELEASLQLVTKDRDGLIDKVRYLCYDNATCCSCFLVLLTLLKYALPRKDPLSSPTPTTLYLL